MCCIREKGEVECEVAVAGIFSTAFCRGQFLRLNIILPCSYLSFETVDQGSITAALYFTSSCMPQKHIVITYMYISHISLISLRLSEIYFR